MKGCDRMQSSNTRRSDQMKKQTLGMMILISRKYPEEGRLNTDLW